MVLKTPNLRRHTSRAWTEIASGNTTTGWTMEAGASLTTGSIPAHNDPNSTGTYVRLVSAAGTASGARFDYTPAAIVGPMRAWIYVDPTSPLAGTDYLRCTTYMWNAGAVFRTNYSYLAPGWNCIQIGQVLAVGANSTLRNAENSWSTGGTFSFHNAVRRFRFDIDAVGSGGTAKASTVYFGPIEVGGYDRPKVILTIDDGYERTFDEMLPALSDNGLNATLYAISELVGNAGYMNQDEFDDWFAAGNDVCNHTMNHLTMSDNGTYSVQQIVDELEGCREWIEESGYNRRNSSRHFASPLGAHARSEATNYMAALNQVDYLTAVTIVPRSFGAVPDFRYIPRHSYNPNTHTLTHYLQLLEATVAAGSTFVGCIHDTKNPTDNALQMDTDDFQSLCRTLGRHNGVDYDVVTMTEWYESL